MFSRFARTVKQTTQQQPYQWLNFIQPPCLLCSANASANHLLCPGCAADLPRPGPRCQLCAEPLISNGICAHCQQHRPAVRHTIVGLQYAWPADQLIQRYKFSAELATLRTLTYFLAEAIEQDSSSRPQALLPVPLHWQRRWQRGFNQSAEIANVLSKRLGIAVNHRLLSRHQATAKQSQLDRKARQRNVRGAFKVNPQQPSATALHHVAIVDDVMTTGATTFEIARSLKAKYPDICIDVWVLARAGRPIAAN